MAEIKRAVPVIHLPGDVVELRALKVGGRTTYAGYFNDFGKLADEAEKLSGAASGVYIVLNQINPDLLARAVNRVVQGHEHLTQDKDVLRRRWLPIYADTNRRCRQRSHY